MFKNLVDILKIRGELNDKGITFIESSNNENILSYKELFNQAKIVLSFFQSQGLKQKDELVFQIDNNKDFVIIFWACILGGIIPVPLTVGRNNDHRQKLYNVWGILNNPFLICSKEIFQKLESHADRNGDNEFFLSIVDKVLFIENINNVNSSGVIHYPDENDIAYLQFSSGSTGNPKGVVLTHKNLVTNMKGISEASLYQEEDSKLSWMPLTHDMGLIGFHLCPMFCGINHFLMPTNLFIRRPALWLDKASQYKVTILCSPNFGYKYLLKQYNPVNEYNWELSNVRIIYNGAEPISEDICNEFLIALQDYGLKKTAMYPVYGLAEASLAVSFSKLNDEVISLSIDRSKTRIGETISLEKENENSVSFVNVGKPIPYCSMKITDDNNKNCGENIIGHIKIKGNNVTSGYYNNLNDTKSIITKSGWLDTGDLGFKNDGCFYITGRSKDIIFINGQNYYPHDIERSLEVIEVIELGKVVIGGCTNPESGEEEILVFILFKGKTPKFIEIHNDVKKHVNQFFGFEPNKIIPVREIPKTTSGKVQRFKLIEAYQNNVFIEVLQELGDLLILQNDQNEIIDPKNNNERKLVEIWSNVLLHKNFGVTQKFFDIGGDSLKGAQVISAIHKEFSVEIEYSELYEKQTIHDIALELEKYETSKYESIANIKKQDSYPLSSAQKRLYYLKEVDSNSIAYNIPVAFKILGRIDFKRFEEALNKVVKRHEILRTCFFQTNGEPKLKIRSSIEFDLQVTKIDVSNLKQELSKRIKPFNLSSAPLFWIELLELSEDENFLFIDFHHIISDGVSISLFLNELFSIYAGEVLPELEIQYKDFVHWENKKLTSVKTSQLREYWLKQFRDDIPILNLPTDFGRPSIMSFKGEKLEFAIEKSLSTRLRNIAKKENTSLFALLLAAYKVLLSKYTGQEDIVTGIPVAGRSHSQLQSILGMFVNNLAIRSFPKGTLTFKDFLHQVHKITLNALSNQEYSFEHLVEQLDQKRDVSRNSLFDTMFIYQNMAFPKFQKENLVMEQFFFNPGISKYDISLEVFDQKEEIKFNIEYSTSLFRKGTIRRFANYFDNLLNVIVETHDIRLSDLTLINKKEYSDYVLEFNQTKCSYPKDGVIHQLFEERARLSPNEIAVTVGNKSFSEKSNTAESKHLLSDSNAFHRLTFEELNYKSNQLANYLRKNGVAQNIPVAIVMDRNPGLIIAILGILKSGGCYLPIDKDLPIKRVKYILSHSQTNLVIADEDWLNTSNIQSSMPGLQCVKANSKELINSHGSAISNINTPNDLAYIIYTSGTTGNPKGVMVEHRSLINYTSFANRTYIKEDKVSFPLYTSISFDLTVTSIFTPLVSGNTIVTYSDNDKTFSLEDVILDNQVHILKATPSHLKMLKENRSLKEANYTSNIRRIVVGGETLSTELAHDIQCGFDNEVEIYNEYGPTEATVGCMIHKYDFEYDKRQAVPIGKPIDNSQIFLLDKYLKPVPTNVEGEIYISGDCLARGYLFNQELTNDKFVINPFLSDQKMYKTGDLAIRLPDGDIDFMGRIDHQVKINGYRVEIEEIEQQILSHHDVKESLVLCKQNTIMAYITILQDIDENKEIEYPISNIQNYLTNRLPHYMLPKHIVVIRNFPLTKNGKVNYKQLPDPVQLNHVKVECTTDIQKNMLSVWQDVLNVSQIGITGNFFEFGGDSIKAVQIASRLFEKNISVNVKDILTYQNIEQLCLQAKITDGTTQYEQGIIEGEIDLNPIQRWFFDQKFKNPHFYNQSVLLAFRKSINRAILKKTFEKLIEHHDGLRMNYSFEKDMMFFNNNYLNEDFDIKEYKLSDSNSNYGIKNVCKKIKGDFNIEKTLLVKAAIIIDDKEEYLFITAHHLIIDGVSWRILLQDFNSIYNSFERNQEIKLPQKTASLFDWQTKIIEFANSNELKDELEYWKNELVPLHSPLFSLPSQSTSLIKDIRKSTFQLTKDETHFLLTGGNKVYNANVEILLVTALVKALKEWKNCDEIIIEMESHGRHLENVDVARTIGWFTSIFPTRFNCNCDTLGEQIKHVKEKIRKIPNHGLGNGVLRYLNKTLDKSLGLNEVRFNYLGQFDSELNNDLFIFKQEDTGLDVGDENQFNLKIEINALIINETLILDAQYNQYVIKEDSMEFFLKCLKSNIIGIIEHLRKEDNIHFTPSDFDAVDLDEEDLNVLFS